MTLLFFLSHLGLNALLLFAVVLTASSPAFFRGFILTALKDGREGAASDDHAGRFRVSSQNVALNPTAAQAVPLQLGSCLWNDLCVRLATTTSQGPHYGSSLGTRHRFSLDLQRRILTPSVLPCASLLTSSKQEKHLYCTLFRHETRLLLKRSGVPLV